MSDVYYIQKSGLGQLSLTNIWNSTKAAFQDEFCAIAIRTKRNGRYNRGDLDSESRISESLLYSGLNQCCGFPILWFSIVL